MSEQTRRDALRSIAAGLLAGSLPLEAAQHVHQMATDDRAAAGVYKPKAFTDHEYLTLQKLADYIIPQDEHSAGANAAGAPAFIDLLASQNPELAAIYTGGIGWLDRHMEVPPRREFRQSRARAANGDARHNFVSQKPD